MPNTAFPGRDQADSSYDAPEPTFAELGVPGAIVRALADDGKRTAFPIQADTLPDSLSGRDVLGRGRTGSGKTLAFSIPMVARLAEMTDDGGRGELPAPRGLVLAPTRELANQINEVLAPLAQVCRMTTCTVYGGVKYNRQIAELKAGADIVVACPGRLEDLLRQNALTLDAVEVVVLDEADEMADMGFLPAVQRLLEQVADDAQHMLFSATLDHGVDKVVERFLHDPKMHSVDDANSHVDEMTHHVFEITKGDKAEIVRRLASGIGKRILFTRTKYGAKKLAKSLTKQGIPCAQLHGNLNQNQRDRNLAAFESGEVNVMAATDVAARGIDVSGVELVVQVEPPEDPKSFLHRSGRTARAGHTGDVVTLVLPETRRETMQMLRHAGIRVKPVEVKPGSPEIAELVGETAELVEGWELAPLAAKGGQGKSGAGKTGRAAKRAKSKQSRESKERVSVSSGAQSRKERRSEIQFLNEPGAHADEGMQRSGRRNRSQEAFDGRSDRNRGGAEGRIIEEPGSARGGKRMHRKPIRVTEDLRGEDAKRHDRRVAARRDEAEAPKRGAKQGKRGKGSNGAYAGGSGRANNGHGRNGNGGNGHANGGRGTANGFRSARKAKSKRAPFRTAR